MSQQFYKSNTALFAAGKEISTSFIDISLCRNTKSFLCRDDVIQIESGFCSMIAVTKQGNVYGRGKNLYGELALGDSKERNEWTQIPIPAKVKQVSFKAFHSLFLTWDGQVYSCGHNGWGQLGVNNTTLYYIAQRVLTNEKAIKVVTGMESFSFVLCEYNDYALCESTSINSYKNNKLYPSASKTILYAFGYNNNGQLGINKKDYFMHVPTQVKFFNDKPPIQDVQAGCYHTMVLLTDGTLYAMGEKSCCGQILSIADFYSPVLVSIGNATKITSVCCSLACTIVQTQNNEWYGFGNLLHQSFPAYGKNVALISERMDDVFPQGIRVKKIVSTRNVFFLLSDKNDLYVVGNNEYGEMGMNNVKKNLKWTFCKTNIIDIQTGKFNSFIFVPNPFLFYESNMKYADAFICFQ